MAGSTSRRKADDSKRQEFSVKGRSVAITIQGEREVLQIDGRVERYYVADDGYLLRADVYQRPAKTLREAVERYLSHEEPR